MQAVCWKAYTQKKCLSDQGREDIGDSVMERLVLIVKYKGYFIAYTCGEWSVWTDDDERFCFPTEAEAKEFIDDLKEGD